MNKNDFGVPPYQHVHIPEPCRSEPCPDSHHYPYPLVPGPHHAPHYPTQHHQLVPQPHYSSPPSAHYPVPPQPHYQHPYPQPQHPHYQHPSPPYHPPTPPPPPPAPAPFHEPFPQTFSFGVGSSNYLIEGARGQDHAGESIWDRLIHTNPGFIIDGSNAEIASDAYNHLEEDVEILNNLTVRHYKFSFSWTRLFPSSCGEVNKAAVKYYERLLQLLRENQIEPIAVLYDHDLPQYLQDQGGFLCDLFPTWYLEYAKIVFDLFGDQVKYWITFNDPTSICVKGYGDGTYAPGINNNPSVNEYICGHNLLKAHADVYHTYDDYYRPSQKGKISIALTSDWYEPDSDCVSDREAAELKLQFQLGWWAHPIYIGDYPSALIQRVGQRSEKEGLCTSRLPVFTRKEIEWIKDTHDFFSLNWFSTQTVKALADTNHLTSPSYENDIGVELCSVQGDVTYGIKKLICWIKDNYYNPSIFITETGTYCYSRDYDDDFRISFIRDSLINIRAAILEFDARVYGYTYKSHIDGFEWNYGYTQKWGLYDVDFECTTRPRRPRKSADYYQYVCKFGCVDDNCPPRHYYHY